ncbi:MAG: hypothetical protein H0V44_17335 [Planctomycetes bacterium]|nr:hypothetical protein [Planctomycetota bacterium]
MTTFDEWAPQMDATDAEIDRAIFGRRRSGSLPHYRGDTFAQGLLLAHLESLGWVREPISPLVVHGPTTTERVAGCRFRCERTGRSFQSYASDDATALIEAALLTLRALAAPGRHHPVT